MWYFPGGGLDEGEAPWRVRCASSPRRDRVRLAAEDLTDLGDFELVTDGGTFRFRA